MNRYSISSSCIPSQRQQSIINPRENSPTDWQFQMTREAGYQSSMMGAVNQSDNMFVLKEGHQRVKNGMFDKLTGGEPIFGHVNFDRNPLDNNRNNLQAAAIQGTTQVQWNKNPFPLMFKSPSQYPNYGGKPTYANYSGSAYFH